MSLETIVFQVSEIAAPEIFSQLAKSSTKKLVKNAQWQTVAAIVAGITAKCGAKYTYKVIRAANEQPQQQPQLPLPQGYINFHWHPYYQKWWWTNGYQWGWL